jgi:hypothetical protein
VATIAAIRAALKTRLETIVGLRVLDYRPGSINSPQAIVARQSTTYGVSFDGADDHTMAITVYVQFGTDRAAEDNLDAYLNATGASSIVAAIQADPTLGGVVDFTRISNVVDNGLVNYPTGTDTVYLAATFTVEVGD